MAVTYAIYSGTTFKVPADCSQITVECMGAGYTNGNGGAYSKTNSLRVNPGSTIYLNIGAAGATTWVNVVSNATPLSTSAGCSALGGAYDPAAQVAGGVGDVRFRGGYPGGFAGGGAAGPNGNGGDGRYDSVSAIWTGGSANNGGPTVSSNSIDLAVSGNISTFGLDYVGNAYGSYGGATAWNDGNRTTQGSGGGGQFQNGGAATSGLGAVYISFVPRPVAGTYQEVFTTQGLGTFRIPHGTVSMIVEGIGSGSTGKSNGTVGDGSNGGGGGSYARTTLKFNKIATNRIAWYNVASPNVYGTFQISHTWFNTVANTSSMGSNQGIRADSAWFQAGAGPGVGQITGNGGQGGNGSATSGNLVHRGGGGGGAGFGTATFGFNGGYGGTLSSVTATSGGGAGGGGAATYSSNGNTGANSTGSGGGAGGSAGLGGGGGGAAGTTTLGNGFGKTGSQGGGGGGAGYRSSGTDLVGGAGTTFTPYLSASPSWPSGTGPGGGGGGGGSNNTSTGGTGGRGADYGGGGGGGDNTGYAGQGIILITYTVQSGNMMQFFT